MIIEYSPKILTEVDIQDKLDLVRDDNISINRFTTHPQGFIIYDTFSNPFFPIEWIRIDTDRYDTFELFKRYREKFTKATGAEMLPWHFTVEMIKLRYYVINTRPVNIKFPLTTNEFLKRNKNKKFNSEFEKFLKDRPFCLSEAIHIAIIGNTNLDVYPKKVYRTISRFCIDPYVRYFRIPKSFMERIIPVNLGNNFVFNSLLRIIRI